MNTDSVHIPNVTPKVSVVIPVWNPGKGISRCVDSLCGQTLEDIEMVFVDDCGTDGAMDIIRAAAAKDPRIRIMTNAENIGPGASRDKAIELAQGEYISFVDADDYIDPDFLEILYWKGKADDLDIIKGTYMREKEDGTVCSQSFKTNDVIREGLGKNKPLFFLFNAEYQSALFHSRLFANPDVRFGLTCNGEDTLFLLKACHVAKSFGIDDRAVYHYFYRKASATNTMTEKSFKDRILALQCIVEYLVSHIEPNPYAVLYFTPKLKYYLSLQRYASQMARMDEISSLFLAGLQELALNYPAIETCKNEDFVIFALMEYGENLVSWFYQSSWKVVQPEDYADVVVRRVDFLQSHPKYYKELPALISKADGFAKRMESDGISKEKIEAYKKQIRALWRKPPIMWMLFKNKLRRVLAKLKKKCFDKKQTDL
jgi:glycosyltransferase involved in cell wall biosynthesis